MPCSVRHENVPHWYLKNKITGEIVDITADQFENPVPYENGRGNGFLTKEPSKRAKRLIDKIEKKQLIDKKNSS